MRRAIVPALGSLVILSLALAAVPAAAKAPFRVDVYVDATGEHVAALEPEQDRIEFISALYDEANTAVPLAARPTGWDYRIVLYFDSQLRCPTEMFYFAPRDGDRGLVYWPDVVLAGTPDPFLVRSASLDALLSTYGLSPTRGSHGLSLPEDGGPPEQASWPIAPIAVAGAAAVAGSALLFLRWRIRKRRAAG